MTRPKELLSCEHVGFLMQTQVNDTRHLHNDYSVPPRVGWSSLYFCFLSRKDKDQPFLNLFV